MADGAAEVEVGVGLGRKVEKAQIGQENLCQLGNGFAGPDSGVS